MDSGTYTCIVHVHVHFTIYMYMYTPQYTSHNIHVHVHLTIYMYIINYYLNIILMFNELMSIYHLRLHLCIWHQNEFSTYTAVPQLMLFPSWCCKHMYMYMYLYYTLLPWYQLHISKNYYTKCKCLSVNTTFEVKNFIQSVCVIIPDYACGNLLMSINASCV